MRLAGKVALITGGTSGIGRATAVLFAREGARVAITGRDEVRGRVALHDIKGAGSEGLFIRADVRSADDCRRAVDETLKAFKKIDVLFNNAGVFFPHTVPDCPEDEWDQTIDVNLKGTYLMSRCVLPHMIAQRSGKIVNISSVTFHLGMDNLTHYVASKGGVIGLTRSVAREMGEHNIHVNCITPGAIKTEAEARVVTGEQAREFLSRQSLQRRLMPLDVARVCLFLSSELSDGMTGQCLNVDAGWVMY